MLKTSNANQWGVLFGIHQKSRGLVGISPRSDLVENIGFDEHATRTKKNRLHVFRTEELVFPLSHPREIALSREREIKGSRKEFVEFLSLLAATLFGRFLERK
jgi:hypothetical protein